MADRNAKGQFVKGHKNHGAGRKPRAFEDNFIALIDEAVTDDDWRDIIAKAVQLAKRGDSVSRQWLADRRFGKAKERNELTGAEGAAIEIATIPVDYRAAIADLTTGPEPDSDASGEDQGPRDGPEVG